MSSPLARNFCQGEGEAQPVAVQLTQEQIDQKSAYQEETLKIDENNEVNIKFNDDFITYEIPDELPGTTYGKLNPLLDF